MTCLAYVPPSTPPGDVKLLKYWLSAAPVMTKNLQLDVGGLELKSIGSPLLPTDQSAAAFPLVYFVQFGHFKMEWTCP